MIYRRQPRRRVCNHISIQYHWPAYENTEEANKTVIDMASFPAGLYHVVYTNGNIQQVATIVKE